MAISALRQPEVFELCFDAHSEDKDGFARILLYGELDIATAPLLQQECERAERRGSRVIALDLGGLTFMDVAGLRALLAAEARAKRAGGDLALVGAGKAVRRVFYLTGNGGLLDTSPALVVLNGDGVDSSRRRDAMRQAHRRDVNESLEDAERAFAPQRRRATFLCECGDPACGKSVRLSLSEYETVRAYPNHFVIVTNHENPEAESVVMESRRFAVVETLVGEASKVALRTNPRALYHEGREVAHG